MQNTTATKAPEQEDTVSDPRDDRLPPIRTSLEAEEVLRRLDVAARRGRLPGFEARPSGGLFSVEAFANPFDKALFATAEPDVEGLVLRFRLRTRRKMPAIFAAVLAVTVWPGVWLTDSILITYFTWYGGWTATWPWLTYAWYLPLTVLPIPWLWRTLVRRSDEQAAEAARKAIGAIAAELEARVG